MKASPNRAVHSDSTRNSVLFDAFIQKRINQTVRQVIFKYKKKIQVLKQKIIEITAQLDKNLIETDHENLGHPTLTSTEHRTPELCNENETEVVIPGINFIYVTETDVSSESYSDHEHDPVTDTETNELWENDLYDPEKNTQPDTDYWCGPANDIYTDTINVCVTDTLNVTETDLDPVSVAQVDTKVSEPLSVPVSVTQTDKVSKPVSETDIDTDNVSKPIRVTDTHTDNLSKPVSYTETDTTNVYDPINDNKPLITGTEAHDLMLQKLDKMFTDAFEADRLEFQRRTSRQTNGKSRGKHRHPKGRKKRRKNWGRQER